MNARYFATTSILLSALIMPAVAHSAVINVYFGWNIGSHTSFGTEVQLIDITYVGGGGGIFTTTMPAFSSFTCSSGAPAPGTSAPCTGMPDIDPPFANNPTYTTTSGGDGETTRTIGVTVPIDWDISGAFPTITITDITAVNVGATWTAHSSTGYLLGLIPGNGVDTELSSSLASPQGDIYDGLAGAAGNYFSGSFVSTSVSDPIYTGSVGVALGEMIFAAAAPASFVPVPAAIWLFGSGLLGLIGIARKRRTAC